MEPLAYELVLQQHGATQAVRLVEDLNQCQTQQGFDVEPLSGSPMVWRVLLSQFPASSRLGQDLMALYRGSQTREASIEILLEFPVTYPTRGPSLRIIEPRVEFLTGGVTFGGTLLGLESLQREGWRPESTPAEILSMVREHLVEKEAGLDSRNFATMRECQRAMSYCRQEAVAASNRHALIDRALQPTRADFQTQYRAHSTQHAREQLGIEIPLGVEYGNRIYLPGSCLSTLIESENGYLGGREFTYPVFFALTSMISRLTTYVSTISFTAPEEVAFLPTWLMQCNGIAEGSRVDLRCVHLPAAKSATLQPAHKAFYDVPDVEGLLKDALTRYCSLTKGDTIVVEHDPSPLFFHVMAVRAKGLDKEGDRVMPGGGVHIIDVDLEVDFAPSPDLEPPPPPQVGGAASSSGGGGDGPGENCKNGGEPSHPSPMLPRDTPAPSMPGRHTPPSAVGTPGVPRQAQEAIKMLTRRSGTLVAQQSALNALVRVLTNIVEKPEEEKFRRINAQGNFYRRNLSPEDGAVLFLQSVGFKSEAGNGGGFLVMGTPSSSLAKSLEAAQEASVALEEIRLAGLQEKEEARKQEQKRREVALGRFKDRKKDR